MKFWRKAIVALTAAAMVASTLPVTIAAAEDEWKYYAAYINSGTFKPPYTGKYKIYCVGKSGDGESNDFHGSGACGGGGGGSGGIAISILTLDSSQTYSFTITADKTSWNNDEFYATAGQDGNEMNGGAGGEGFKGNVTNQRGYTGGLGGRYHSGGYEGWKGAQFPTQGGNGGALPGQTSGTSSTLDHCSGGGGGGGARLPDSACAYVVDSETMQQYHGGHGTDVDSGYNKEPVTPEYPELVVGPNMKLYGGGCGAGGGSYSAWGDNHPGSTYTRGTPGVIIIESLPDTEPPIITDVSYNSGWTKSLSVQVIASDAQQYTITQTNSTPSSGWQSSNTFTVTANGTYYAWAKDATGNISSGRQFKISNIDTTAPTVNSVSVPSTWGQTLTVTVNATDTGSGIAQYGLTQTAQAPSSWQGSNTFKVTANGTYYAWAKDQVGNVSAAKMFSVTKVDDQPPSVIKVTEQEQWGKTSTITITGEDKQTGVTEYAYSSDNTKPNSGWQSSNQFTFSANGGFFAWVKDTAGNVSPGKGFSVTKVDDRPPVIEEVLVQGEWGKTSDIQIVGTDQEMGISGYAYTTTNVQPEMGWQTSNKFTVRTGNGTYYAWMKDLAGNISASYPFEISFIDATPPEIQTFEISEDALSVELSATDEGGSQVKGFLINGELVEGNPLTYSIPETIDELSVQAQDHAGNLSTMIIKTVPDMKAPWIVSVEFEETEEGQQVTIVSEDKGSSGLKGVYINDKLFLGNPVTYVVPPEVKYLEIRAVDKANNRSDPVRKRVPGWSEVTKDVRIHSIEADEEITQVTVTASSLEEGSSITGAFINGSFYPGSEEGITCPIPAGQKYLDIQAVNNYGDRSEEVHWRVPGWWEVREDTITIDSILFTGDNRTVIVAASTTDPDNYIAGIYINEVFQKGNPVICQLPEDAKYLTAQAADNEGDRSEVLKKRVPGWSDIVGTIAITSVEFSQDYASVKVEAYTSREGGSIAGIYVNGKYREGNPVEYTLPAGTRYVEIQARDDQGDLSPVVIRRTPGWWEELDTITVDSILFTDNNTSAVVSASTTDPENPVAGIYINGTYQEGNPVVYPLTKEELYLTAQAVNTQGDRSKAVKKRVPGWSDVLDTIAITSVEFSQDDASVKVRADTSRAGGSIAGIYINGQYYEGNPVECPLPAGTKYVRAQARDDQGDLSPEVTRRVPGWSETLDSIVVTSIQLSEDRTMAVVHGQDTSGKAIQGIYVNDTFFPGNPVMYTVPDNTSSITAKAVNEEGDQSKPVTVEITPPNSQETNEDEDEEDEKTGKPKITIYTPDWVREGKTAQVEIKVKDEDSGVSEVWVKTTENPEWELIAEEDFITIHKNTTVTVKAVNGAGEEATRSKEILCFDSAVPTVSVNKAGTSGKVNILAKDDISGVETLYVNSQPYDKKELKNGLLSYTVPEGVSSLEVWAEDAAGNRSKEKTYSVESGGLLDEEAQEVPKENEGISHPVLDNPHGEDTGWSPNEEQGSSVDKEQLDKLQRDNVLLRLLASRQQRLISQLQRQDDPVSEKTIQKESAPLVSSEEPVQLTISNRPKLLILGASLLVFLGILLAIIILLWKQRKDNEQEECDEEEA